MTRARDAVITLLCLMVLVPLTVVAAAVAGLDPRHWSGIPLSGVELPLLGAGPRGADTRLSALDGVTDVVVTMEDHGWVEIYGGQDGRVYIMTSRLSPSLLPDLGRRFDGDEVGVVYSPRAVQARLDEQGGSGGAETWWHRADPLGTWVTLTFGFPWPIGVALLLTAIGWVLVVRRRRRRRVAARRAAGWA